MRANEKVVVFGPALPLNLAPIWVAYDKGFFKEEGLDIELRPVQGIPDSQHPRFQWRHEGKIVFQSPGGSPPFRSVLENRDHIDGEINVVSIANRTAHVFVARQDIKDPAQLKGKRIAGDLKGGSSMDAKVVLRHFGVDPEKDITWIDSRGKPPNTERFRLQLFEKGEVDAICSDPPHWNIAVEMGGRQLTSCRDLFALPEAGFSTSPAVIAEKPQVVKGMVKSILRGTEIARLSKEETLDSIMRHNHYITREMASTAYDAIHKEWGPVLDMEAYQRKVDIYTREWKLPPKPVSGYYNFRYLKEALDELGMLRSWDKAMDNTD
jgi:ABC-type nitrate/sulfonate/bicarbonate transport system substrate-binding protein